MSIQVTPIPRLTPFANPAFTLGTANAGGSAKTTVTSDSTLLAFDAVAPANVAASAVVGTAVVSSRRDHVHAGVTAQYAQYDGMVAASSSATFVSPAQIRYAPTVAKAWLRVLANGTLASPDYNIDSVTINGTGDRTAVFGHDFSSTVYAAVAGIQGDGNFNTDIPLATFALGSLRFVAYDGGAKIDVVQSLVCYGIIDE